MNAATGVTQQANSPRCAIYARYAANVARPKSIDQQIGCCREAAAEQGWTVEEDSIYVDTGTETLLDRVAIKSLISDAKTLPRAYDILMVDGIRHISRNVQTVLEFCDDLGYYGVGVYFVAQKLDSRAESFRMIVTMFRMINEQFRRRHSLRVRAGLQKKGRAR
jgi:DNA invertase Pin-like site-specific DNA recombinase